MINLTGLNPALNPNLNPHFDRYKIPVLYTLIMITDTIFTGRIINTAVLINAIVTNMMNADVAVIL